MKIGRTFLWLSLTVGLTSGACAPKETAWERARAHHCQDVAIAQSEVQGELEVMVKELSTRPPSETPDDLMRACVLALDHFDRVAQKLEWLRGSAGSVTVSRPDGAPSMIMDFGGSELRAARHGRSPSCGGGRALLDQWLPQIETARVAVTKKLAAAVAECAQLGSPAAQPPVAR